MKKFSRFESMPPLYVLHLLLNVTKTKCQYVDKRELITYISQNEKFQTMRYARSFARQLGAEVKPYDLDRNLFLDITDIFSRENNKHYILSGMCVFMMLYLKVTEEDTPKEVEKVKEEIRKKILRIITEPFYGNEQVSRYLCHKYNTEFENLHIEDITQFAFSLGEKLILQGHMTADQKEKVIEIFEQALKLKLSISNNTTNEPVDFSYFSDDEREFVCFLVTGVVLPVLTDSNQLSIQLALDLMSEYLIEHADIAKEALAYDKIFK